MKPEEEVYYAIHKLVRAPEFLTVWDYLERRLRRQDVLNRTAEGVQLHQGQGRSQLLQELIDLPAEASSLVRKRN